MPAGALHAAQLPASLRAIDSVAEVFNDAAREIGCRVYGHPGGLTVRERYALAEKREILLRKTRDESILQKEKQRILRGEVVGVEKNARRRVLDASCPCGRNKGEGMTTLVASIKSAGVLRSANLRQARSSQAQQEIMAHIEGVRAVMKRMDRTFGMARARQELRTAIQRRPTPCSTAVDKAENVEGSVDRGRASGEQGASARRCREDCEVDSPRERYVRRRAAVCLQRCTRGRTVRKVFGEVTWAVLHFHDAGQPSRYSSGHMGRKAMLLGRLRVVVAAHKRISSILNGGGVSPPSATCTASDAATKLQKEGIDHDSDAASPALGSAPAYTAIRSRPNTTIRGGIDNNGRVGATGHTLSYTVGDGSRAAARRERRIVVWALRDVAARIVQEEARHYARTRFVAARRLSEESSVVADSTADTAGLSIVPASVAVHEGAVEGSERGVGISNTSTTVATCDSAVRSGNGSGVGVELRSDAKGLALLDPTVGGSQKRTSTPVYASHGQPDSTHHRQQRASVQGAIQKTLSATVSSPSAMPLGEACSAWVTPAEDDTRTSSRAGSTKDARKAKQTAEHFSSTRSRPTTALSSDDGQSHEIEHIADSDPRSRSGTPDTGDCTAAAAGAGRGSSGYGDSNRAAREHVASRGAGRCRSGEEGDKDEGRRWRGRLLPSEERKRRRNKAHLRRNRSRLKHKHRSVVGLECQGSFVLPEIIWMQRRFRAKRARRIYNESQAKQEEQDMEWQESKKREQRERADSWGKTVSRFTLLPERTSSGVLAAATLQLGNKHGGVFAGVAAEATVQHDGEQHQPLRQEDEDSYGHLVGKELAYVNAAWSLAVAHDLGSWGGGLRQRYYFGRLVSFLTYRQRRKAALRSRVERRMAIRLENWAMALSTAKRALVARIKAEASPELAGAHLRYLGRGGTWECLLLHMTRQVEAAEVERERAVALLRGQHPSKATVGPPLAIGNTASTRASSLSSSQKRQRQRQRYSGDSGSPIGGTQAKAWGPDSRQFPGKSFAGSPGQADVLWAGGKGGRRRSRSRSDALQDARLKGVVGERTLRCLHPWVVSLLKTSGIQFVPSVPTKHRVGYRMADAAEAEKRAEGQLTRRYWKFVEGISLALVLLGTATAEASALTAEAGEWSLLLGFAHHLTSSGVLDPPCMLPALPSRENNNKISSNRTPTPTSRHTNMFPAPTRHSSPHQTAVAWFGSDSRVTRTHHESHQDEAVGGGGEGGGDEVPINRWVSSVRELCEGCCAMRTGVGARRGSKCERCGRTACRGFAQKKAHTTRTNGAAGGAGPVPWQQLSKVEEPVDMFIIHAAFSCVLHPSYSNGGTDGTGDRCSGWWHGGTAEEAWWRAVCGGKRAAAILRGNGYDTVGKLYALACSDKARTDRKKLRSDKRRGASNDTAAGRSPGGGKLQRLVEDRDLAAKIWSLLQKLLAAFEGLRRHQRWPTVDEAAVEKILRPLHLPQVLRAVSSRGRTAQSGHTSHSGGDFHRGVLSPNSGTRLGYATTTPSNHCAV